MYFTKLSLYFIEIEQQRQNEFLHAENELDRQLVRESIQEIVAAINNVAQAIVSLASQT